MAQLCVFGDSIVHGDWDLELGGWVHRLRLAFSELEMTGNVDLAVYDCGVNGNRVADVLARFATEAAARQPDHVILAVGINDAPHIDYDGTPLEAFEARYERLVDLALAATPSVVLMGLTNVDEEVPGHGHRNELLRSYNDAIQRVSVRRSLTMVEVFGRLLPADLVPDGYHPSASGHRKMYELAVKELYLRFLSS